MDKSIEITGAANVVLKALKFGTDELKGLTKLGIKEYLTTQMNKYSYVNTFLHRGDKVKFEDIYYPLKISNGKINTNFKKPQEFLDKNKYISIIGTAGSGKSTLVKYIFQQTLNSAFKIPVIIELRDYNWGAKSFEDTITDIITKRNVKPNADILKRALRSGQFVFIMDGFDEVYSEYKKPFLLSLDEFIDIYPNNNYIVTSRQETGIEHFHRFKKFTMCPLTPQGISGFIRKMVSNKERRTKIIGTVKNSTNSDINKYFESPLLLSMFILVFENYPEIPTRKTVFYRHVFDTLYSRHDGQTKNSFKRERRTNLERDDFESVLQLFSFITFLDFKFTFNETELFDYLTRVKNGQGYSYDTDLLISDLSTSLSIMTKDGLEYKFPHRSLQEYFCALFISNQREDKKERIYRKLLETNNQPLTMYECSYLIDLCAELDEFSLYRYYTKPILEKILYALFKDDNIVFNIYEYCIESYVSKYISDKKELKWWIVCLAENDIDMLPSFVYNFMDLGKLLTLVERATWEIGLNSVTSEDLSFYKQYENQINVQYDNGITARFYELKKNIEGYMNQMESKYKKKDDFIAELIG